MHPAFIQSSVGDIVAKDVRTASVFEQFGIDFCCGGRLTVGEACEAAAADPGAVERALDRLSLTTPSADENLTTWPLPRLIDHIVNVHHAYVRSSLPTIAAHLTKLIGAHGERHPELRRIAEIFDIVARDLLQHMMKEERVLFPYVRELAEGAGPLPPSPFGTVENPIRMMEREHQQAGHALQLLRMLTDDYVAPADACATYRVAFTELADF